MLIELRNKESRYGKVGFVFGKKFWGIKSLNFIGEGKSIKILERMNGKL